MEILPELLWKMSWQTAILAGVVWMITRLGKRAPAAWRHALWLVVLVKFFVPPFAYVPPQLATDRTPAVNTSAYVVQTPPVDESPSHAGAPAPQPISARVAEIAQPVVLNPNLLIVPVWLIGLLTTGLVLLARYRRQKGLLASGQPADEYSGLLRECADLMGVRRVPRMWLSDRVPTPMLTGLRRPTILLPTEITGCGDSDLRAMLMHELAHVKRGDMAVIWLHQFAQMLFFFHPAVWVVGHELKREREIACDEMVLSKAGIPHKDYASGYVAALRLANDTPRSAVSLAMAEPFEVERRRVQLMLREVMPRFTVRWAIALAVVVLIGGPTFIGCKRNQEIRTKVTDNGFTLDYKNPPTWKWKDLSIVVKSIGRSKWHDRATGEEKGMML